MEKKNSRKKETIQLRYYELPEQEPVLTLLGPEWMRSYGTIPEDLHFHNLMEIGLCQWGEGTLCIDGQSYQYQDGAVTLIPANCLHTTLSRDQSVNQWEYLFLDPGQILNKSFPNDPMFVESVTRRLSSSSWFLPAREGEELARLIRSVLDEYRGEKPYHSEKSPTTVRWCRGFWPPCFCWRHACLRGRQSLSRRSIPACVRLCRPWSTSTGSS